MKIKYRRNYFSKKRAPNSQYMGSRMLENTKKQGKKNI